MTTREKVSDLNQLFRIELGSEPVYKWAHVRDPELILACEVYDPETRKPVVDMVCACGKNVSVHKPWCRSLTVPQRRFERKHYFHGSPLFDKLVDADAWVLIHSVHIPRKDWEAQFGSLPYQKVFWKPAAVIGIGEVTTRPGEKPDADTTRSIIALIKYDRETPMTEKVESLLKREKAEEDRKVDYNMGVLDEVTGVRAFPGKVDGNVSLPTPQHQQFKRKQ